MDALTEFLDLVRSNRLARGRFRGFLHVLIGRRILNSRGDVVSAGMSFRDVAALLKKLRWEPEEVQELKVDAESLPPRDRQRFWFMAICQAGVDSEAARDEAVDFARAIQVEGYQIVPTLGQGRSAG